MSKKQKHILVIRLSAMGDVAMTVPVLSALTQQYPELKVSVLTRTFFKPFFRDLTNTNVILAEVKGKHKGFYGLYKLGQELNNYKFHAIADLHNVLRTKLLKQFVNCKQFVSIDKGRREKQLLISGKHFIPLKTTHQRYADVFEALGYKLDLSKPMFPASVVLNEKLQKLIGGDLKKVIGIAPFATYQGKMYPLDLMEEVIEQLSADYHIVLFGGGNQEEAVLSNYESVFNNVVNVAGKLSLSEEIDLISNLDVMLSMDSGNAHIAAMLGIKVISIWGVTHPYAGFAPFNQPEDYALLSDRNKFPLIPTSVYGNKYPDTYKEASRSVTPHDVIKKIKSVF